MRLHLLLSVLLLLPQLGAQDSLAAQEAALNKSATSILLKFARAAKSKKHGPMERSAYARVIEDYDSENSQARRALDWKKDRKSGEWELLPLKKRREWLDQTNRKGRFDLDKQWRETCQKLAGEHRKLGLTLMDGDGDPVAAVRHLELAILYDPFDKESHDALGHEGWESNEVEYFGSPEQVAFMQRMKDIETFALTLAKRDYDPQPVEEIPERLKRTGLTFRGARTKNLTVFVRGTQDNANDVVEWGERALDFLDFIVQDDKVSRRARAAMKAWGWIGYLWTPPEMDKFKKANAELLNKDSQHFNNIIFGGDDRKARQVTAINMPSRMHDHLISHVFQYGLGIPQLNDGLGEGVHHAATWFLKSTCATKFGAVPEGTTSGRKKALPEGANWWLREMRNQAIAGTDVKMLNVPRTSLSSFAPDVRLKTWSWNVWAMARFPDKWLKYLQKMPADKPPFPDVIEKLTEETFGMSLDAIEAQWRLWASGRDVTAAATGYGPPLLPEFPNDDELDGLERLNAVRSAVTTWGEPAIQVENATSTLEEGWQNALNPCELDSEATAACKDHAKFLTLHKDHWVWPEAHEEDPAKEGFTPRGMRAGLRSVIVMTEGQIDAAESVDQWIGTVYHRFPLLEYNIKRFGIAHADGPEGEVIVLDMGSLQEPKDRELERRCAYIAWPPNGMKNVPLQFAYTEHPNPVEDKGLSFDDQKQLGYPVSLQFSETVAARVTDVSMELYTTKKRGGSFGKDQRVPSWMHTPDEPLYERMVMRNVVFAIPKELLKPRTTYMAVVDLVFHGNKRHFEWTFTTGSKKQGLGRLK